MLESEAEYARPLRRNAFDNVEPNEPIHTLIDKVANRSYAVTDEDVAAARASGLSDDQIFELIVCAAVGAADRQYQAATAALAQVTSGRP